MKKPVKTESDVESLQEDLEVLYLWARDNNMKFNGTKFQVLRFGENVDLKNSTNYFTDNMSHIIEEYESVKDLGVIMNNKATFDEHLEKAVRKARQKLGWIMRTFRSRQKWFMRHLFKSLVIPHLDYCSQLWMPVKGAGIHSLEKVQSDYFKKIPDLKGMNYWEALEDMKMISIQRRFERYRVIYVWKIMEDFSPNCGLVKLEDSEETRLGRRIKVPVPNGSTKTNNLKEQAFQINGAKLYNCLPSHIRNQTRRSKKPSLHSPGPEDFKVQLDIYLSLVPDQPRIDGLAPGVENNSILHQTKRGQGGGLLPISGA